MTKISMSSLPQYNMVVILLVGSLLAHIVFSNYTEARDLQVSQIEVEDPAVINFRQYLRINSAHPAPDYESCITWLQSQAEEIGLDFHLLRFEEPDLFALWMTWNGTNPNLQSILLNSHMDVVAVDPVKWIHDPFAAFKDEDGNIFGRGSIDMKSATVGQLEAIRHLKAQNFQPLRTVHLSVLPDEEVGGHRGIRPFLRSSEFASLNVGFDIDESGPSLSNNQMFINHAEKSIWQFNFTVTGSAGHGSTLPNGTAGEKLKVVIDRLMSFRATEVAKLSQPNITIDDVTSLNLVRLGGGTANNIIPGELWASFDMRIRVKPGWSFTDVENMLNNIAEEAGPGVTIHFIEKSLISGDTAVTQTNVWWVELQRSCQLMGITCTPFVTSAATDGRYVRDIGIPVLGINPFLNTASLAHQDNEFINEVEFLAGISRYELIIKNMASLPSVQKSNNSSNRSINLLLLVVGFILACNA